MPMTDEEAALQAISTLDPLSVDQHAAKANIDSTLGSDDPYVDIHKLFGLYNVLYFRSLLLPRVEVTWSSRLTLCVGICELVRDPNNGNKYTRVRLKLSEPLLKYRPRSDVINTLLHEAIHSYLFITTSWRHARGDDGTGHGAGFLLLADAINNHGGYEVNVFHTFHDEVDSYRTHIWQCDGPCKSQAPFFGIVKRSMNRPPSKGDPWWRRHEQDCGGVFTKVAEPELSKEQVERLSGLKKAGRQKNKLDEWVSRGKLDSVTTGDLAQSSSDSRKRRKSTTTAAEPATKRSRACLLCPICAQGVTEEGMNEHIDLEHPL
ncbi:hypothetical protein LTR08_002611 [Meristemomyces frigidus]|nr:hypothetical protein LTR08_002611 [Meristemomyces frigidus]